MIGKTASHDLHGADRTERNAFGMGVSAVDQTEAKA